MLQGMNQSIATNNDASLKTNIGCRKDGRYILGAKLSLILLVRLILGNPVYAP